MKYKILLWTFVFFLLAIFVNAATLTTDRFEGGSIDQTLSTNKTLFGNDITVNVSGLYLQKIHTFGDTNGSYGIICPNTSTTYNTCMNNQLGNCTFIDADYSCTFASVVPLTSGTVYFIGILSNYSGANNDRTPVHNAAAPSGYPVTANQTYTTWHIASRRNDDAGYTAEVNRIYGINGTTYTDTPSTDLLNISSTFEPANNANFTTYMNISFNTTVNSSSVLDFNCSLFIDGVEVNSTTHSAGTDVAINFTHNFLLGGVKSWYIGCYNSSEFLSNNENTSTRTLNIGVRLNITATNLYNNSDIGHFDIYQNGTLKGSATTGNYMLDNLSYGSYNITFMNNDYQTKYATININQSFTTYQFAAYTRNAFNFTFKDEDNESIIDAIEITVEFIGDSNTYNYTTTTGLLYADIIYPEEYTIRYKANQTYQKNHYIYLLTNRSHQALTLYMTNNSDAATVTIYDAITLTKVEGAVIYMKRWYQNSGSFKTVQMYESDPAGKGYFYVDSTEYYKFQVDYPLGTVRLNTEKFYIEVDNINLYINLQESVGQSYFDERSITYSITHSAANRRFTGTWSDVSNVATKFCFYIREYVSYGKVTHNNSCSESSSGSIELGYPQANQTYYAVLTTQINGEEKIIDSAWIELIGDELDSGTYGIFLTAILIMVFTLMGAMHILALMFANLGLIFAKLIGIFPLDWSYIITIFIASFILGLIIQIKKG